MQNATVNKSDSNPESKPNYKQLDIELRNLVREMRSGETSLYQIAIRFVKLWSHAGEYARALGLKPHEAETKLRSYLRDYNVDPESLVAILAMFPTASQWADKALPDMMAMAREKAIEAKRDSQRNAIIKPKSAAAIVAGKAASMPVVAQKTQAAEVPDCVAHSNDAVVFTPEVAPEIVPQIVQEFATEVVTQKSSPVTTTTRQSVTLSDREHLEAIIKGLNAKLAAKELELKRAKARIVQLEGKINRLQKNRSRVEV